MFIVLEGLDGAGKSTQLQLLETFYHDQGKKVKFIHFPRFDAPVYGGLIARFLRGDLGSNDIVSPFLVALLYAEDRKAAAPLMRRWMSQGYIVLADRFVYSNIAYQCAKFDDPEQQEELRRWILDTEYREFALPHPDINLFLDIPLSFVAAKLREPRSGEDRAYLNGKADIHEANLSFQARVREQYLGQAGRDAHFRIVDCSDGSGRAASSRAIFERILLHLK